MLGYPDEDTLVDRLQRLPPAPADPLGASGTYMVWRKLHQDVALWRSTIARAAERYGDAQRLAAKVVGRWPNGAPLSVRPNAAGSSFDAAAPGANDFRYGDDRDGRRCPLGAHIRRSNPRDALGFEGALSMRHRMIRRGMPYGPPLPEGVDADDGTDRGLVFVSFQASIARQFEGVQGPWLSDGNIFGLGHDKDFLLGRRVGRGQDDDPGGAAVLPRAAAAARHDAWRRVPVRARHGGAAGSGGRGGRLMSSMARWWLR